MADKKKFKDTKVGEWLKQNAPKVLDTIGDALPGVSILTNAVKSIAGLTEDKQKEFEQMLPDYSDEYAQHLLDQEKERTERLRIDMTSDSWLSKNIRPMSLVYFHIAILGLCVLDACGIGFKVAAEFVELFKWAYMTALSFYFVGREVQKFTLNKRK